MKKKAPIEKLPVDTIGEICEFSSRKTIEFFSSTSNIIYNSVEDTPAQKSYREFCKTLNGVANSNGLAKTLVQDNPKSTFFMQNLRRFEAKDFTFKQALSVYQLLRKLSRDMEAAKAAFMKTHKIKAGTHIWTTQVPSPYSLAFVTTYSEENLPTIIVTALPLTPQNFRLVPSE